MRGAGLRRTLLLALLAFGCKDAKDETDMPTCADAPGCVVAEGLSAGLLCVRALADDDVWIVGASPDPSDGTGPVALHFDGSGWTRLDTSTWAGSELWWAWVTPSEAVFVGNGGLILEHDRASGALAKIDGPDAGITFFGVWGAGPDDLWAVGMSDGGNGPAALWRRQQGVWAAWEDPVLGAGEDGATWFKVHGTAANDVWLVGTQGRAAHWDGSALTLVPTDGEASTATAPLLTVDAGGERPIAVGGAGNGLILEYDGTIWKDLSPDFVPGFNGVCTGPDGSATAVGQYGLYAVRDGGTWVGPTDLGITPLTTEDWHGCAVTPTGRVWVVGGHIAARPLNAGVIGYRGEDVPVGPTL